MLYKAMPFSDFSIRYHNFTAGVYEEEFCVSREFWPQNMVYAADHCVRDVSPAGSRTDFSRKMLIDRKYVQIYI
jgi:hypothetical protein